MHLLGTWLLTLSVSLLVASLLVGLVEKFLHLWVASKHALVEMFGQRLAVLLEEGNGRFDRLDRCCG